MYNPNRTNSVARYAAAILDENIDMSIGDVLIRTLQSTKLSSITRKNLRYLEHILTTILHNISPKDSFNSHTNSIVNILNDYQQQIPVNGSITLKKAGKIVDSYYPARHLSGAAFLSYFENRLLKKHQFTMDECFYKDWGRDNNCLKNISNIFVLTQNEQNFIREEINKAAIMNNLLDHTSILTKIKSSISPKAVAELEQFTAEEEYETSQDILEDIYDNESNIMNHMQENKYNMQGIPPKHSLAKFLFFAVENSSLQHRDNHDYVNNEQDDNNLCP